MTARRFGASDVTRTHDLLRKNARSVVDSFKAARTDGAQIAGTAYVLASFL